MQNAEKSRIAVVGDAFLDIYHFVSANRQSEEAPIPIHDSNGRFDVYPGGAANVAQSLSAMGDIEPCLFLTTMFPVSAVFPFNVAAIPCPGRDLGMKHRYFHKNSQVFRVDVEPTDRISEGVLSAIVSAIAKFHPSVIVISDYAKGVCSPCLLHRLSNNTTATIIIDAKHPYPSFEGAHTVKINKTAALRWSGATSDHTLADVSLGLRNRYHIANLIITLGKHGAMLNDHHIDAPGRTLPPPPSTIGAGDTYVAAYAASIARGLLPHPSAAYAALLAHYACQSCKLTVHA